MRSSPTVLHVDMDAFYAAVEILDDPSLAKHPLIVGGSGRRGVVASCNYLARTLGVRSAMPSHEARRRCPTAVFVPGRHDRYAEVSTHLHEIFRRITPLVEGISLDEAFLDVAGAVRLLGPPAQIADDLRRTVRDELSLTCSVGAATTKSLAKLASEAAKPKASSQGIAAGQGVVVIGAGEELEFLHPHPIEAIWGVGPVTASHLHKRGINTVGELAALSADTLVSMLGSASGQRLHELAWARDPRPVEANQAAKSISFEETYQRDRYDHEDLHGELVRLADAVAGRTRAAAVRGKTITVKMRFADFSTVTRSRTLPGAVDSGPEILKVADALMRSVDPSPGVRLLGVGVSSLVPVDQDAAEQLTLDLAAGPSSSSHAAANKAVDAIRDRYGSAAVGPAALLGERGIRTKRRGSTQWGPDAES